MKILFILRLTTTHCIFFPVFQVRNVITKVCVFTAYSRATFVPNTSVHVKAMFDAGEASLLLLFHLYLWCLKTVLDRLRAPYNNVFHVLLSSDMFVLSCYIIQKKLDSSMRKWSFKFAQCVMQLLASLIYCFIQMQLCLVLLGLSHLCVLHVCTLSCIVRSAFN